MTWLLSSPKSFAAWKKQEYCVKHYFSTYLSNDGTIGQSIIVASCDCTQAGLCEIQLSEPLMKSRSSSDLKNTLLHEMIHAFLWIRKENCNHGDHGPSFLALAASINSNLKIDHQRPSEGYNITTQHGFQNEVDTNGTHLFMCQSCGDSIKQSSKEPSPSDCTESQSDDKNCGNLLCEWYRHENLCSGWYEKVDNILWI
ncbi:hypothetical protein HPP92_023485 [Vanilla planifolia]|uniref:SprT-like domain-containing protein n=1 Tax=Vanilla planifolia TaxID=51239 RepID=A0A835PW73_VANPL|nr:hypothetical protein HPP92_023485 [Vanilla planifolia]